MKKTTLFCLAMAFALLACNLFAQDVPLQIFYQGNLASTGGSPVDGTQPMAFSIWNNENSTDANDRLWQETHASVQVNNGLFSVLLGSQKPIPANVFSIATCFLEVTIAGETLSPRQLIVSVPYSYKAASVSGATNVFPASGNVGIGTTEPGSVLELSSGGLTGLGLTTTGASGARWQLATEPNRGGLIIGDVSATPVGMLAIDSTGNVGIGTIAPDEKLSVAGVVESTSGGFKFPDGTVQTTASNGGGGQGDGHSLDAADGAPVDALFVNADGKVGIATSTPQALLHVKDVAIDDVPNFLSTNSLADYAVDIQQHMQFGQWDDHTNTFTERMRISSSGKLGIGTTDPTAVVQSTSSDNVPNFLADGGTSDYAVPDGQVMQIGHWNSASSEFTERLRVTGNGDIGIGTQTPGIFSGADRYLTLSYADIYDINAPGVAALELQGGANVIPRTGVKQPLARIDFAELESSGSVRRARIACDVGEGGSELTFWVEDGVVLRNRLRIDANGNVGISRENPQHLLDVSGGAYCDGTKWVDASSRAYKDNIRILSTEAALSTLNALEPVAFNYKTDKDEENLGFIAEDVPDLVATNDRKGLSAMDIVAVLTKVVQQQQSVVEHQQKQIDLLEKRLNELQ